MKRWAVLAAIGFGALVLGVPALADQTFNDSTGETAGSADISTVAVSNNATAGTITFVVASNMTTLEANSEFDIYIDADSNTSTGLTGAGFDYVLGLDPGGWFFGQWNGSAFASVNSVTDPAVFFSNGTFTFTLNTSDFGSPAAFNFAVLTLRGPDPNNPITDLAPDSGEWTYTLTAAPPPAPTPAPAPTPTPVVATVSSVALVTSATPKAGKPFTASLKVNLSTGISAKATGLKCTAKLAGKAFKGSGTGGCTIHLPKTAKGKSLVVHATGKYKTTPVAATKTFKVH